MTVASNSLLQPASLTIDTTQDGAPEARKSNLLLMGCG